MDSQAALSTGTAPSTDAATDRTITIVLADDHQVVRSGLRVLLESDGRFSVLDEAADVAGTIAKVRECRPRVLVLDLNMVANPLGAIPQLRSELPGTQIVVLTMQESPAFAQAALRAGAVGYVLKDAADAELMNAVVSAADGRTYLNPELGAKLAAQPPESDTRPDSLLPREVEVLGLIALGHTNSEIAASLVLSVRTVESHRAHVQQKIGLTSRSELVGYARERGLLS